MAEENRSGANSSPVEPGPFLAKVISVLDPTYMGSLEVQLLHEVGNDEATSGQTRVVKYLSPFYGVTNIEYVTEDPDVYQETQKAYGMWMVPPDVGTLVVCIFIGGDVRKGYWMGCVQDENMNFSLPGYASTLYAVDDSRETDTEKERVPVGEYNKLVNASTEDPTKILKPEHPFAKILESQGLLKDDIRGITTSSARRDLPSMVFGFSTPGPVDKTGKLGKFGKKEHKAKGFVSRLGGSSFVMDDGDDKFLRKTTPTEGPPEYATVENDEDDGLKDKPHNELIRLRTRTGHQILLHNSEDLIYIGNSRGTAWVELTSDGKIDIFSEDSISVRTKQDFNFFCDRDFNLEVGRNFNTKVHGEMHTNVMKDQVLIVDRDQKIHIKNRKDETIDEQYRQTVNDDVKKYYAKDYTHNIDGRLDWRIAKGISITGGRGASGTKFGPMPTTSQDPANPVASDEESSSPVEDVNGETPDRIDIKIYKDMRIWHLDGKNIDHHITGYVKTKVDGDYDLKTESTYEHTNQGGMDIRVEGGRYNLYTSSDINVKTGAEYKLRSASNLDINAGGYVRTTSGGTNETLAGGNIIETAPQIHMNGPAASTAALAQEATAAEPPEHPEEARVSAKSTIPLNAKTHQLPDLASQDSWESLGSLDTILRRVPTYEPYPHHENLDPQMFKPDKLDRDGENRYHPASDSSPTESLSEPGSGWRSYSTRTDTFEKVTAPEEPEEEQE